MVARDAHSSWQVAGATVGESYRRTCAIYNDRAVRDARYPLARYTAAVSTRLTELRDELSAVDHEILELVAKRQQLVSAIGAEKQAHGRGTRDFGREKVVLESGRATARELGLDPGVAERLLRELIQASLTSQEQLRVAQTGLGVGRRALILGGRGKMGRWFAEFLSSQGFEVATSDPSGPLEGAEHVEDWQTAELTHDLVVVATPLGATNAVLHRLAELGPTGLVLDLGSLKTPLRTGLTALLEAGCRVTSVHPMFGPDTALLSGRHVIFVDLGVPGAVDEARELFASTMAERVDMGLDEHDQLIAYVLGLSHAVNIAFFTALTESRQTAEKLATLSSTTFDAQLAVASRVAAENPALYFEIQHLNEHGAAPLAALQRAVNGLCEAVATGDEARFVELMAAGEAYLTRR